MPAMVATDDDPPLYRDLLRFKPEDLTPNAWAVKAGVSRQVWSDMRRHGNPSRRTLEKLLAAAGSSLAEFEALRIGSAGSSGHSHGTAFGDALGPQWRAAPLPPLPIYWAGPLSANSEPLKSGRSFELDFGKVIGKTDRPLSLAGDRRAFAFPIAVDAMWPRFRADRLLLVSPVAKIVPGDDVLLLIEPGAEGTALAVVAELVGQDSGQVGMRQFNPDHKFDVPRAEIADMHKIVGEAV